MARNVLHTRLCDMFGIQYPIVAFTHCKDVVAAVSQAGGLAVLGEAGNSPDEIAADVKWIRDRIGDYPFGIDLLFPASIPAKTMTAEEMEAMIPDEHRAFAARIREQYNLPEPKPRTDGGPSGFASQEAGRKQAETVLDLRVPILASGLGNPAFLIEAAHARGLKLVGLIGKVRQARREIEAGVDIIVAQGHDAGGHNSPIGTYSLVPQVVRIAGDTPVLLAGGAGTGEHLVAALALGAVGIWTGSIWLTSHESSESLYVKEKLVKATEEDTIVTRALTGKPARLVRNAWTLAWEEPGAPKPLPMPLQSILGQQVLGPAQELGLGEFQGSGAGQVIGTITAMKPCREIVLDIMGEAYDVLDRVFGVEPEDALAR